MRSGAGASDELSVVLRLPASGWLSRRQLSSSSSPGRPSVMSKSRSRRLARSGSGCTCDAGGVGTGKGGDGPPVRGRPGRHFLRPVPERRREVSLGQTRPDSLRVADDEHAERWILGAISVYEYFAIHLDRGVFTGGRWDDFIGAKEGGGTRGVA